MSYVEILILRHLTRSPAHGYELRKRVEKTTGVVLHNNSLYPALKRFEEAGAVTREQQEPEPGRPPRLIYTLTPLGRELLHDMLAELPPDQAADDIEFQARLGQFALLSPAERIAVLDARDAALGIRAEHLRAMHALAKDEKWAGLTTAELIRRAEQEREWIARLRAQARD
jgi:DNA-binding PadR family transcriptional regulator